MTTDFLAKLVRQSQGVSKIWVTSIYTYSKFVVVCKNADFECRCKEIQANTESPRLTVLGPIELHIKIVVRCRGMVSMLFVKVTLYSVYVYGRGTFCYVGLPMFLHRYIRTLRNQVTLHGWCAVLPFIRKHTPNTKLLSWVLWNLLLLMWPSDLLHSGSF